jgi:cytoskeletal protein CcmA (bactofilin family)
MALGKVESIDPNNSQFGTVSESETGDIYNYDDPRFKEKGLVVGSPCTFTIDYSQKEPIATDLQPYVPSERTISSPVEGPIATTTGETLRINKGGVVKGNINVSNNSTLFVEDTGSVEGEITVQAGSNAIVRKGGMVKGNINVSNASALKVVNKGVVKGNINYNSGNKLIIGNDNGGGTITGSVTTDKIRKLTITSTSVINCGA